MKELNDSERLEVAMSLLSERDVDAYAERCRELELNCEANGFYNTPAKCEDSECSECEAPDGAKRDIDCPYVD